MDYQVRLSPSAQTDIEDIVRYISIDDPNRALIFGRTLIQHIKNLSRFPEQGRIVPETNDRDIREIIFRAYRIVYQLDHYNQQVQVVRVWHAARGTPDLTTLH
jgi:toxin ParE1/3/4